MSDGKADLHPDHARLIISVAVGLWTIFHLIIIPVLFSERNYSLLLIITPSVIINIWGIIKIIKFYKHNPSNQKKNNGTDTYRSDGEV